jgi:3-deoxy-7-phosphoheptulonate synthase
MIVKLNGQVTAPDKHKIKETLEALGLAYRETSLYGQPSFLLYIQPPKEIIQAIADLPGVEELTPHESEYILSSQAFKSSKTIIDVAGQPIGGDNVTIMAGPCSVESEEQIFFIAEFLSKLGVKFIRGGAYKPRTSPYRFQGMGHVGLRLIREAADAFGLRVVTEIIDSSLIDEIYPYADVFQVGSRNMQNYFFLKQLGKTDKPILLKRGMYARIDEWLMAADYILSEGNGKVILCERGLRTFDSTVRNTMDIAAIPLLKQMSHLPVIADPSHGTGRRDLVEPMSMASIAAGADGLIIEVHPNPPAALSDGMQSLYLEQFKKLLAKLQPVAKAVGRSLDTCESESSQKEKVCVE